MKGYYYAELEVEVGKYLSILEQCLSDDSHQPDKQIISMLLALSVRLTKVATPDVVIELLAMTALNGSFFPKPYLFEAELERLEFHP